jgi:hypothetical protein
MPWIAILAGLVAVSLPACAPAGAPYTVVAPAAAGPTNPPGVVIATNAGLHGLSFKAKTYKDVANGFALDYPEDWTLVPTASLGPRAEQAQLLSPGTDVDTLAQGGSRVSITIYQWDPKNDLPRFVAQRKSAWVSSGSTIVTESEGKLLDGRQEMDFVVQTPENPPTFFLFATLGNRYLQVAGEGDLTLASQIAHTLRPTDYKP